LAEINWTQEAQTWLKDIYRYIAVDDPKAAVRTIRGIYQKAQLLKQHPEIGHKYDAENSQSVRVLLYGHYRIAYLVKHDSNIDILGVFHGALDIHRYLL